MRVLLDENLDHRLRSYLAPHEAFTVTFKGWAGLQNGELLRAAEDDGIQVLLTGDQTLALEQNLAAREIAVVVLTSLELPILKRRLPQIIRAIEEATPGSVQIVECGSTS